MLARDDDFTEAVNCFVLGFLILERTVASLAVRHRQPGPRPSDNGDYVGLTCWQQPI